MKKISQEELNQKLTPEEWDNKSDEIHGALNPIRRGIALGVSEIVKEMSRELGDTFHTIDDGISSSVNDMSVSIVDSLSAKGMVVDEARVREILTESIHNILYEKFSSVVNIDKYDKTYGMNEGMKAYDDVYGWVEYELIGDYSSTR